MGQNDAGVRGNITWQLGAAAGCLRKLRLGLAVLLAWFAAPAVGLGQALPWARIVSSGQAIDWSQAGVGQIPARATQCAVLAPPASLAEINLALAACAKGETVYLSAGTYSIPGSIEIPSNVTLRAQAPTGQY